VASASAVRTQLAKASSRQIEKTGSAEKSESYNRIINLRYLGEISASRLRRQPVARLICAGISSRQKIVSAGNRSQKICAAAKKARRKSAHQPRGLSGYHRRNGREGESAPEAHQAIG